MSTNVSERPQQSDLETSKETITTHVRPEPRGDRTITNDVTNESTRRDAINNDDVTIRSDENSQK